MNKLEQKTDQGVILNGDQAELSGVKPYDSKCHDNYEMTFGYIKHVSKVKDKA